MFKHQPERLFTRAILRPPSASFVAGLTTAGLGVPDYDLALLQYAKYSKALELCGLSLTHLEGDERFPDSTFVEDTAVLVRARQKPVREQGLALPDLTGKALADARASAVSCILTRPGAPSRMGEVEAIKETVSRFCSRIDSINEPGTLDGGDICEAGNHFFIGISERTNESGAGQLTELLTTYGYSASCIDIRGVPNILHLKSGLAYLGENRLVVIDALRNRKEFQDYDIVPVNAGEEYAANCVLVNDHILIAAGYPVFEQTLRNLGYQTIALQMTEFQKMDGGLSCLSLRF